ncbi:hypothetical protein [Streptomyces sp. H34-S4]|uniref:hypothetical protein n=1 Tax=Streptomyces sp. H34-S4 TaxID=2996463 RepID=UPI003B640DE4
MLTAEPLISGDLLIIPVSGKKEALSAYSLTDGHRVWRTGLGGERVLALAPGRPGEVDVLTRSAYWSYLWRLDVGTGAPEQESAVLRDAALGERVAMFADRPGGPVFVNLGETAGAGHGDLPAMFSVKPVRGW